MSDSVVVVFFLQADKHQSFLEDDSSFLMGLARHAQSIQTTLQYLCNISRKKVDLS